MAYCMRLLGGIRKKWLHVLTDKANVVDLWNPVVRNLRATDCLMNIHIHLGFMSADFLSLLTTLYCYSMRGPGRFDLKVKFSYKMIIRFTP